MDLLDLNILDIEHALNLANFTIDEYSLFAKKLNKIWTSSDDDEVKAYCKLSTMMLENRLAEVKAQRTYLEEKYKLLVKERDEDV